LKKRNREYYHANKEKILFKNRQLYEETILALKYERGGKCEICGYNKRVKLLQFHHTGIKSFTVSSRNRYLSIEKLRIEANKCQLLCPTCHYEITFPE
jgi:hypothetical protein